MLCVIMPYAPYSNRTAQKQYNVSFQAYRTIYPKLLASLDIAEDTLTIDGLFIDEVNLVAGQYS